MNPYRAVRFPLQDIHKFTFSPGIFSIAAYGGIKAEHILPTSPEAYLNLKLQSSSNVRDLMSGSM